MMSRPAQARAQHARVVDDWAMACDRTAFDPSSSGARQVWYQVALGPPAHCFPLRPLRVRRARVQAARSHSRASLRSGRTASVEAPQAAPLCARGIADRDHALAFDQEGFLLGQQRILLSKPPLERSYSV